MIVTRKDSAWKCLLPLYDLDFNVKNAVKSNTNKKLVLQMGRRSLKRRYFDMVILTKESIYGNRYGC